MGVEPVRFEVWSDFLCPWCYVAALRLHDVARDVGDVLEISWRAFLLRPEPTERTMESFTRYTEHWARPAAAEPRAEFRTWSGASPPPSHSRPCAVAGKAVQSLFGPDGFDRFHLALMHEYFAENRTISDRQVMLDVAAAVELDAGALASAFDNDFDTFSAEVVADHRLALAQGIAAVPTVIVNGEHVLQGAMTVEQYQRIVARLGG
jgi:predicted DsbA family dithiol-disulfide isomerase